MDTIKMNNKVLVGLLLILLSGLAYYYLAFMHSSAGEVANLLSPDVVKTSVLSSDELGVVNSDGTVTPYVPSGDETLITPAHMKDEDFGYILIDGVVHSRN